MAGDCFRCPTDRHITSHGECAARAARRHRGCVSCRHPRQVKRDDARIERLRVGYHAGNGSRPLPEPITLVVDGKAFKMSKRVAQALQRRLGEALEVAK